MERRKAMNYFPKKLSTAEQQELCKKLPDAEAKDTLIIRNMRLVAYIAKKFSNTYDEIENFISIGTIGLIKAVNTFNCNKGIKFATYATRCIENEILMYLRKENKKHALEVSLDTVISSDDDGHEFRIEDIYEDKESRKAMEVYEDVEAFLGILNNVSNMLYGDKSIKELIILMYMISKKKQKEIEEKLGISQSYVSRICKKEQGWCQYASKYYYRNEGEFLHFYKEEESLCLKIQGYPTIKTTFEQESFEKIADFLAFLLM